MLCLFACCAVVPCVRFVCFPRSTECCCVSSPNATAPSFVNPRGLHLPPGKSNPIQSPQENYPPWESLGNFLPSVLANLSSYPLCHFLRILHFFLSKSTFPDLQRTFAFYPGSGCVGKCVGEKRFSDFCFSCGRKCQFFPLNWTPLPENCPLIPYLLTCPPECLASFPCTH